MMQQGWAGLGSGRLDWSGLNPSWQDYVRWDGQDELAAWNHLGLLMCGEGAGSDVVSTSHSGGRTACCSYASIWCDRADGLHRVGLVVEKDM